MEVFPFVLFALYGLCIGSFLNVVVYRLPLGLPIALDRSKCPKCQHILSPGDLVPLFSFLFLRGKCWYCSAPISWQYPGVEALTGLAFGCCGLVYGFTLYAVLICIYFCILITAWFIDLNHTYIPDRLHLIILGLAVLSLFTGPEVPVMERLAGLAPGTFMLLLALLTDGGIGGGDIKLLAASGLLLGWKLAVPAFFLAYLLAAVRWGPAYFAHKVSRGFQVAMAPYFSVSLMVITLFGRRLTDAYFSFFLLQ